MVDDMTQLADLMASHNGHQADTYYWEFNDPLWILMDTLRQDFPIWGDYWKIFRTDGKELKPLDKSKKLGFSVNEYVSAKLYLLHMPNASTGYTFSIPNAPRKRSREEEAEEEVYEAVMVAATMQKDKAERKRIKLHSHSKAMSEVEAAHKIN